MAALTPQTVDFLIRYLEPDADDWGPRVRDALTELSAYELDLLSQPATPVIHGGAASILTAASVDLGH
ncbi:MAG: hypothetical protein WCH04_15795 [Gammaproteobacteria bacterium]